MDFEYIGNCLVTEEASPQVEIKYNFDGYIPIVYAFVGVVVKGSRNVLKQWAMYSAGLTASYRLSDTIMQAPRQPPLALEDSDTAQYI